MGRGGVTYTEVMKSAEKLKNKGIIPTIDRVREILGTGSKSTLAHHLKRWKESTVEELEFQGLPTELAKSVKNLHEQLQNNAEEKITEIESRSQKEIAQLLQQIKQEHENSAVLKRNILTLENKNATLAKQITTLEQTNAELQRDYNITQLEKAGLAAKIQEKTEQIGTLKEQLKSVEHNSEHYLEMLKQQRDEEKMQFARHLELLQQENNELKIKLTNVHTQENTTKQEVFLLRNKVEHLEELYNNKTKECEMLSNKLFLAIKKQEELIRDLFGKASNERKNKKEEKRIAV